MNAEFGNGSVTAFQTPAAFEMTGEAGYGLVVARAAPGVSQAVLDARLAGVLPGYQVQTGSQFASEEADSGAHVSTRLAECRPACPEPPSATWPRVTRCWRS